MVKSPELWDEPNKDSIPGLQLRELEQIISPWNTMVSPGKWE